MVQHIHTHYPGCPISAYDDMLCQCFETYIWIWTDYVNIPTNSYEYILFASVILCIHNTHWSPQANPNKTRIKSESQSMFFPQL